MLSFIKKEKRDLREEMLDNLRLAHRQWKDKENYFESVTDPDLIDYAIYDMEASKLKYIYLLKQMKEWDMSSKFQEESKDEDISISG
ncbi:DUF2508 family protein [Tissierella praeacuta]|uniref:DUF2508 family protein n=1 Tax=Tissierella praeacuta TaxID=43131 RepID=UPI001C128966|nr:DUF2508 family protein [Tissierella praeacuta]MBU5255459.1 YaaL family protein [Tissierella praeacuta]